jgi:5-formyltetrahydrofolate cyclo-ligase
MSMPTGESPPPPRKPLRAQLLERRQAFVAAPGFEAAHAALFRHLAKVLAELEPQCLGVYWAMRSEFNAAATLRDDPNSRAIAWALPFVQREPRRMHYRAWDRSTPSLVDECGIATAAGAEVVPDVVLAPCVGFTAEGHRLGYGGGYFDRWLEAHPHVTAIGVAWSVGRLAPGEYEPQVHDLAMAAIVTELGVV